MDRTNKSWKGKHGLRTTLLCKLYRFLSNVFLKHQYDGLNGFKEGLKGCIQSIVALYPEPTIFGIVFLDMCRIKHLCIHIVTEHGILVFVFQRSDNKSKKKLAFFADASAKTVSGHSDFMQFFFYMYTYTCL